MPTQYFSQTTERSITAARTRILEFRSPVAGTITSVTIYAPANVGTTNTFDVNLATVSGSLTTLFPTQSNRPSITSGNYFAANGGSLSQAVSIGDIISVDADVVNETLQYVTMIVGISVADDSEKNGIFAPPRTSINTEDDEFEGTSLASKWTTTKTNVAIDNYNDKVRSALYMRVNSNTGAYSLKQSYTPGAVAFTYTFCFSYWLLENFNLVEILIGDTTLANAVVTGIVYNAGIKLFANKITSGTTTYDIQTPISISDVDYNPVFLHVQRTSGGSWSIYYSNNGIKWTTFMTSYGHIITVNSVQIELLAAGNATVTIKPFAAFHWIRRDWLTL